jgi:NAD-dependent dihydropyrimidine dehydrogenase PreA subunit
VTAVAIDHRCTACGLCLLTCPEHALTPAPKRPALLVERCTGCFDCVEICPTGAITPLPPLSVASGVICAPDATENRRKVVPA